jgi:hypothetical protein
MPVSQNGYTANDESLTQSWKIPGTTRAVRLRKGAPGNLLVLFAAWFDKSVEDIEGGELDDWGYAERPIRGSTTTLSNHASGTAMDLNATRHPLGKRGTFTPAQAAKIRAELKRYGGCIRWGGDYSGRPDEMHFEIVRDVATCNKVLQSLTQPPPQEDDDVLNPDDRKYIEDRVQAYAAFGAKHTDQVLRTAVAQILKALPIADDDATAAVAALNTELDKRDAATATELQGISANLAAHLADD